MNNDFEYYHVVLQETAIIGQKLRKERMLETYLNCSEVIPPPPECFLSRYTKRVVKMEKAAPNPRTTMYPTAWERGASPSKKLDMPAYSEGWLLVTSCRTVFIAASIFVLYKIVRILKVTYFYYCPTATDCHDLLDLLLLNSLDKKALFDVHVKYFKLPSKTIHQNHL
jgi:hypothetical protein